MRKIIDFILSALCMGSFFLLLVIFQPIQWIAYQTIGEKAQRRVVEILNFFLVGTLLYIFSKISFTFVERPPLDKRIIFIANHQSLYDIPPLIWFLRKHHAKFISKIELTKGIPSISFNLKYGGGANIDRKDSKQAVAEILKLAERIKKNNWSTVIFPEGTRSKDGKLKPFAIGGVATILKKVPNALIVPIVIRNSWKLVQFGTFPLSFGERMRWEILEPLEPEGKSMEEIISYAEESIKEAIYN